MSDFLLRPFLWADIPALTAIYAHYVEHTAISFDAEAPDEAAMAEKFGHLVGLGHPLIIAESGGKPLGFAYASFYRPRAAYRFTAEDSIYLHPDATGKGMGKALLAALLDRSKAAGFHQMLAVITADTANSIRLHEKFGFEKVGHYREVGFKFERWHDVVHLQKAL